jgi:membrane fusion protein, multidrug efflux system
MNIVLKNLKNPKHIGGLTVLSLFVTGLFLMKGSEAQFAGQAPQAIPVTVKTLKENKVKVWSEFSARLRAVDMAEIRPEVAGKITEIKFEDGQQVNKGDVLFVIDPRTYQANVSKAEAALATARYNSLLASKEKFRADDLIRSDAISKSQHDERVNAARAAAAAAKVAEAEQSQAKLMLEYANVRAPISGRAGRAEITVGNLVAPASGQILTTIVSSNGIYADFEVDEQTYLSTIRKYAVTKDQETKIPVALFPGQDKSVTILGNIHSFDNSINSTNGTIRARAKFDNNNGLLVPGMFATVRLAGANETTELLLPEKAIGFDQNKKFVFVVGAENKVQYREVELGKKVEGGRVVLSGLKAEEKVITEGLQHVRPDAVVTPTEEGSTPPEAPKEEKK